MLLIAASSQISFLLMERNGMEWKWNSNLARQISRVFGRTWKSVGNLNRPAECFVVEINVADGSIITNMIPFDTSKIFLFKKINLSA